MTEVVRDAVDANAATDIIDALKVCYEDVRAGIGFNKPPRMARFRRSTSGGAKQPGMTGRVKEEVLTRLDEIIRIARVFGFWRRAAKRHRMAPRRRTV